MRIVGFEVTPRSVPHGYACTNVEEENYSIVEHGGQKVVAGDPIQFSYQIHIKHSDRTWATRMEHYMNYGSAALDWESFAISIAIVAACSLVVFCILASILNKDFHALKTLR